jgi:heme-degrading monooxygenase HmoA
VDPEKGLEFEEVWRKHESYLKEVEGFVAFHFLRGSEEEYISHSLWESEEAFKNRIGSEPSTKPMRRLGRCPRIF